MTRHFLNLSDAGGDAIAAMINDAMERKAARKVTSLPRGAADRDAPGRHPSIRGHSLRGVFWTLAFAPYRAETDPRS